MYEKSKSSCFFCLLVPLILGLSGLFIFYFIMGESLGKHIENDLSFESNKLIGDQQVGGVTVNMDGRDAVLTGSVVSQERSHEIENMIAGVYGIRKVDNQLQISIAKTPEPIENPIQKPFVAALPDFETLDIENPLEDIAEENEAEKVAEIATSTNTQESVEQILQTLDLAGIQFLFGSDQINPSSLNILNDVAATLNEHSEFNAIIEGHTDSIGDDQLNLELSQGRATSVMNYLISQGIDSTRLQAVGYGENAPISDNDSKEGRALNRRIEFSVKK